MRIHRRWLLLWPAFCLLALGQSGESYWDLMKQGDQLAKGMKWSEALEMFRSAVGRTGGDPKRTAFAASRVGEMYEKLGDLDDSLDWYRTSEASAPYPETEQAITRLRVAQSQHIATAEEIKRGLIGNKKSQRVSPSLNIYVNFDTGKDLLTKDGEAQVAALAEALKDPAFANNRFSIIGHTDKTGGPSVNQPLSEHRALRVATVLTQQYGFEASRFDLVGMGAREPLAPGDDDESLRVNRRVEIKRQSKSH